MFAQRGSGGWRSRSALWIAYYLDVLIVIVPRIRRRSEALAHARADLTGRIVDAYANIQTVKLFAQLQREDEYARDALATPSGRVSSPDAAHHLAEPVRLLAATASLIVVVGALSVWLWSRGALTLGDIARGDRRSACAWSPCPAG